MRVQDFDDNTKVGTENEPIDASSGSSSENWVEEVALGMQAMEVELNAEAMEEGNVEKQEAEIDAEAMEEENSEVQEVGWEWTGIDGWEWIAGWKEKIAEFPLLLDNDVWLEDYEFEDYEFDQVGNPFIRRPCSECQELERKEASLAEDAADDSDYVCSVWSLTLKISHSGSVLFCYQVSYSHPIYTATSYQSLPNHLVAPKSINF